MCGIAGKFNPRGIGESRQLVANMLDKIAHRGPDGSSIWSNPSLCVGHNLLRIRDNVNNSTQPMVFEELVISFNGEIYNSDDLKKTLVTKGYAFNTETDTEVILKGVHCFGINFVDQLRGDFAIALYNSKMNQLYLLRDYFGVKPMYYTVIENELYFCSEIKGLLDLQPTGWKFNTAALLTAFANRLWIGSEETYFENIHCINPGTMLICSQGSIVKKTYYTLGQHREIIKDDVESEIKKRIIDSVHRRLVFDGEIGGFLSGGLDSSIVCHYANTAQDKPLQTFIVKYNNDPNPDIAFAQELAVRDKIQLHITEVSEDKFQLANIDRVIYAMEEILLDKVYISIYENYKSAHEHNIRVILSGQGSDETWLGYYSVWLQHQHMENRETLKKYLLDKAAFRGKLKASVCDATILNSNIDRYFENYLNKHQSMDHLNNYLILACNTILHNLLLQEDKLAMAHSVEARVPFVERDVIDLAFSTSGKQKIADGKEKFLLRKAFNDALPPSIINRKKLPFPEPSNYNKIIRQLLLNHIDELRTSKIISAIIREECLADINCFTDEEQWLLLAMWRFEVVFSEKCKLSVQV